MSDLSFSEKLARRWMANDGAAGCAQKGGILLFFAVCILMISALAVTLTTFTMPVAGLTQDVRLLSYKDSALNMVVNTVLARCGKVITTGNTINGLLYVTENDLKKSASGCNYDVKLTVNGAVYEMTNLKFTNVSTKTVSDAAQDSGAAGTSGASFEVVRSATAAFALKLPSGEGYQVSGRVRFLP